MRAGVFCDWPRFLRRGGYRGLTLLDLRVSHYADGGWNLQAGLLGFCLWIETK